MWFFARFIASWFWQGGVLIDLCREVLSFYCSEFTKCDVIAKFLGPIYQGLSKVCIAVGAHLIPALPIYVAKHLDRRSCKITDFISCSFVVTNTNQVKLVIVLIGQWASLLVIQTNWIIVLGILCLINDSITEVVENHSLFYTCIKLYVYSHAYLY